MSTRIEANGIYVALESFWWHDPDTGDIHVRKGITRFRGSDPAVQANPQYWTAVQDSLTRDVEQATREPGEKRGQSSPANSVPIEALSQGTPQEKAAEHAAAETEKRGSKGASSTK